MALETAYKTLELFTGSRDNDVIEAVMEAYSFLYEALPDDDPRFVELCTHYGKFLERSEIAPDDACQRILAIDEHLDGRNNAAVLEIITSFLSARSSQLSEEELEHLHSRSAANYLFLNSFEEAIGECVWLLTNGNDKSRLDYTLWCGEAFLRLDRVQTASMFFREVIRATSQTPQDERAIQAGRFLAEINSDETEHK